MKILILILISLQFSIAQVASNFLNLRALDHLGVKIIDFVEGDQYNYMYVECECNYFEINEGEAVIHQEYYDIYNSGYFQKKTVIKLDKDNNYIEHLIFKYSEKEDLPNGNLSGGRSFGIHYRDSILYIHSSFNNVDSVFVNDDLLKLIDDESIMILKYNEELVLQDSIYFSNQHVSMALKFIEVREEKMYLAGDFNGAQVGSNSDRCFEIYGTEMCVSDMSDDMPDDLFWYKLPSFQFVIDMETDVVIDYHMFGGYHGGGISSGSLGVMQMHIDANNNTFISTDVGAGYFRGYGMSFPNANMSTSISDVVTFCADDSGELKYSVLHSGGGPEVQFLLCIGEDFIIEYGVTISDPYTMNGIEYEVEGRAFILRRNAEGEVVWFKAMGDKAGMWGLEFDNEGNIWASGSIGLDNFTYGGELYETDFGRIPPTLFHIDVETGELINYYTFNNLDSEGELNLTNSQEFITFVKPLEDGKLKLSIYYKDILPLYGDTIYADVTNTVDRANIIFDFDPSLIIDTEEIGIDISELIMLYPNPIHLGDKLNCIDQDIKDIKLYELGGKLIWEGYCGSNLPHDIATGIYLATYAIKGKNYTTKIKINK